MFDLLKKSLLEYDPHYITSDDVTDVCFIESIENKKENSRTYHYGCCICGVKSEIVLKEYDTEGGSGFSIHSFTFDDDNTNSTIFKNKEDDIWDRIAYGEAWTLHSRLKDVASEKQW